MAVRRPCVERPESGQHAAADQEQREDDLLEVLVVLDLVKLRQVECANARLYKDSEDPDEDEHAGAYQDHRQLDGAVLLSPRERGERTGRAPDANQQIHREDGQLVEEEPEEQVKRGKHAKHARHEQEEQDEVVLVAVVDLRGDQCGREGHNARQQHHGRADAIDAEVQRDPFVAQEAHVLDPCPLQLKLVGVRRGKLVSEKSVCREPEEGEASRDRDVAHEVCPLRRHSEEEDGHEQWQGNRG